MLIKEKSGILYRCPRWAYDLDFRRSVNEKSEISNPLHDYVSPWSKNVWIYDK